MTKLEVSANFVDTTLISPGGAGPAARAFLLVPFALAVLQRLGDVGRVDEVGPVEVGDSATDHAAYDG